MIQIRLDLVLSNSKMLEGSLGDLKRKKILKLEYPPNDIYQIPSGKIEFTSNLATEFGLSPLPDLRLEQAPDGFPIRLLSSSIPRLASTLCREVNGPIDPEIWISEIDAKKKGLIDGQEVTVPSPVGSLVLKCRIDPALPSGIAWAARGTPSIDGKTLNDIIPDCLQEIGGGSAFNSTYVHIYKR